MINEEKLRDKVAEILLSPQKNGQLDRIIDAVYEAMDKQRTSSQNRALHKDCSIIAEKLNDAGYDVLNTIKILMYFNIPWTTISVKDILWRPIMKRMCKKESTTELRKSD